ncbi:hypothetical protein, partial [Tsukamurella conjunctivitidis]|uniref:hypothetical protein n=1 Tax=Tsukamurella conjunctivitidis TaxID=2592068 RepID=UPI00195F9E01
MDVGTVGGAHRLVDPGPLDGQVRQGLRLHGSRRVGGDQQTLADGACVQAVGAHEQRGAGDGGPAPEVDHG